MTGSSPGPTIVIIGIVVVLVGLAVWSGALGWFGRLPGDIRIDSGNVKVFAPLGTMLLLSVILTVVLNLLNRR